ncbi:MAG: hypothetical protein ACLFTK_06175 [Anaerolineales bacterium]
MNTLIEQNMGWAKLVGLGAEYVNFAVEAQERNITPIIRIYRPEHSGVPIDNDMRQQFLDYLRAGIKWFEIYNEPNLSLEWPPGANYDPMNTDGVIRPICDNWLDWAEFIIDNGGYPGFIPLSEAGGGWENTTTWINQLLLYMFERHYQRFVQVLDNGFWLGTHPYILNHFYQEMPGGGPLSARPPEMQNYAEPGWHFEYPYDPICQASDPGRTVWGETPLSPQGDVHGLYACGIAWLDRLGEMFGVNMVPVVGTEGGLWPQPERGTLKQLDIRYPGFTWESHAHATTAMFDFSATQTPPWFWGVALWKWDYYYSHPRYGGRMPATDLFSQHAPPRKPIVSEAVMGPGSARPDIRQPDVVITPPGPGPVHGTPEHHFIILAPGFDEDMFFNVCRVYCDRFRPTVMTIYEFINLMPTQTSLAVTVITNPDLVDFMNAQVARRWTNVYMDMVVVNGNRELEEMLNSRVAVGRRFG